MSEIVLKGEHLTKTYGGEGVEVHALQDVSFEIRKGEFIVVLGPSGSGKSTLLNMIGGMDQPTDGRLFYKEEELTGCKMSQLSDYRKKVVGFVFQFFNLIPSLTAYENVQLAADIVETSKDTGEVMRLVGLEGREQHFPSQLSGGEQQRVSIARAIVKNPDLLLCDEPTGALDSVNSRAVLELLLEIRDKEGCPVVMITHNAEFARIADRVFCMKDGRMEKIVENDNPCTAEEINW